MDVKDILPLVTPPDVLVTLRTWLRCERQRIHWTQAELAQRSGVPAATISRLELTGLASTEALMRVLFALNRLEAFADFLKGRQRLANIPLSLNEDVPTHPIQRVRHRKESP